MATLPKPKSIPDDVYNEKLIKIADDEVVKIHNNLFEISKAFKMYFILYRSFANISMIALVCAVFMYGGVNFYFPVVVCVLTAIVAQITRYVSEECINGIIILNTEKETKIYELAFKEFSSKE